MKIVSGQIITIFGGTGFIGRHIVPRLTHAGYIVKVASRAPAHGYFLRPAGSVGQVVPVLCDYNDPQSIAKVIEGSFAVINCIGTLHDRKKDSFEKIHVGIAGAIARACAASGVERLIHISALGIDQSRSKYASSKKAGEEAIKKAFPAVTILRPSVVFGPEDRFFNMFAEMARYLPALPLIGGGGTKFQPVYVGDVAEAVMAALRLTDAKGKTFELGGPEVLSFREIYKALFACTGRERRLISLPWKMARVQAGLLSLLPRPPLTVDQVESLKTDNVVSNGALDLRDLGINPTALGLVLPAYLAHYRAGGPYSAKKRA